MMDAVRSIGFVPLLVVLSVGLLAALMDVRSFRISNLVTLPLLVAGLVFHSIAFSGAGLAYAAQGAIVGFACLILFYALGGMGAGDVKLLTAVGAWIGPHAVFGLFIVSSLLMCLYAVSLTWWQGRLYQTLIRATLLFRQGVLLIQHVGQEERVEEVVLGDTRRRRLIPFAAMLLGGIALLTAVKFIIP